MAIPTTASYEITRNDLITGALSIIGVSEPGNEDMSLGVRKLNSMIRNLDAKSTWLWALSPVDSTLTTIASQDTYVTGVGASNIATNILKLEYASIYIGNEYRPLTIYDKFSSFRSTLRDDTASEPLAIFFHRANLPTSNTIKLFPTPNSAYEVKYNYRRPLADFTNANDNPDFPSEWFLPLQKMLAYELSWDFSKPLAERQLLEAASDKAYREVEMFNADKPSYTTLKTRFF